MVLLSCRNIRTHLIILLFLIVIGTVECRPGGRSRAGRVRALKLGKSKLHFANVHRVPLSSLHKPANQISMRKIAGGSAALIVGTLAMQSYVSNNHREIIRSRRRLLTNGTGNVCVNRENFSNFVFNEFRCPLSPIFSSNKRHCCGPAQQQYCCSFWEGGGRAIGAIIGIISACALFFLFIICCVVYYRRHLKRQSTNDLIHMEQPSATKQSMNSRPFDSPPPYSEAVRRLTDV